MNAPTWWTPRSPTRFARAASLGLAAGLLFADGDISAKIVGYGGWWLGGIGSLIGRLLHERPAHGRQRSAPHAGHLP